MPFAKSSVRLGRMTRTGSTRFFPKTRLKSCLGGGEVYSRPWALHAQFAEVQAKDELSGQRPPETRAKNSRGGMARHPSPTRRDWGNALVAICGRSVPRVY